MSYWLLSVSNVNYFLSFANKKIFLTEQFCVQHSSKGRMFLFRTQRKSLNQMSQIAVLSFMFWEEKNAINLQFKICYLESVKPLILFFVSFPSSSWELQVATCKLRVARVCPTVCPTVYLSVRRSVRLSNFCWWHWSPGKITKRSNIPPGNINASTL